MKLDREMVQLLLLNIVVWVGLSLDLLGVWQTTMDIKTDFIPKPGDRVKQKMSSGQTVTYVWAICPDCLEGRWISLTQSNKLSFTGRCKKCSILRAKTQGWVRGGIIVETTK